MKIVTTISCRSGGKIFSYFFPFRSLFNSRGLGNVKGLPPLSTTRKGDGCVGGTDHLIRHPRVHPGERANAQARRSCARQKGQNCRGMAPSWAGATPLLHSVPCPKVTSGSLQPNKRFPSVPAARILSEQLKKVGITYFCFIFNIFFSLGCA